MFIFLGRVANFNRINESKSRKASPLDWNIRNTGRLVVVYLRWKSESMLIINKRPIHYHWFRVIHEKTCKNRCAHSFFSSVFSTIFLSSFQTIPLNQCDFSTLYVIATDRKLIKPLKIVHSGNYNKSHKYAFSLMLITH